MVDFNPYREWLGVESSAERPNHYELLGLPPYEPDSDRISHAADQRLNLVRKVRPGAHIDQWQRILDELVEIRKLLTDLERKRQYDDQLRRQQGLGGGLSAAIVPANPTKQDSDVQVSPVRNLLPPTADELARETAAKSQPAASATSGAPIAPTPSPAAPSQPIGWPPGPAAQAPMPANAAGYGHLPYGTGFPVIPASYGPGAGGPPASAFPAPPGMSAAQFAQSPTPFGQQPAYGQQSPFGQQPAYGQQPAFGQAPPFGHAGYAASGQTPYGQPAAPGYPGAPNAYAGAPTSMPGMANPYAPAGFGAPQSPYGGAPQSPYGDPMQQAPWGAGTGAPAALAGGWGGNAVVQPGMGMPGAMASAVAPMAVPIGRMAPAANPMAPVETEGFGTRSFDSSSTSSSFLDDQPAPTVSAAPNVAPMLAARRRNSQSTLLASGVGGIVGLAVLFLVLEMMKNDETAAANPGASAHTAQQEEEDDAHEPASPPVSPNPPKTAHVSVSNVPKNPPKPPVEQVKTPNIAPPVAPAPSDDPANRTAEMPTPMPNMGEAAMGEKPAPMPAMSEMPVKPENIADPSGAQPAENSVAEMTKALAAAKAALVARNVAEAKTQLTTAGNLAKAPDHIAMVERLEHLTNYVAEFWKGVADGMKALNGVEELEIGDLRVRVVAFSEGQITIRASGKNLSYTVADVPSGLAEVLFEQARDMKDPINVMTKGCFHATDKNRSAASAREVFQRAQLLGADVTELLAVLDDKYDVKNLPVSRAVAKKQHLPDQSAMSEATTKTKAKFGKEINSAKTAQQKYDMAKRLLEEAQLPMENEALRLAIFNEARDLASNAKLAQLTVQIIDETEKWFEIDVLAMKLDALSKTSVKASPQASRDVAMECLQLTDQAQEAKRLDLADKFVRIASGAARASRDLTLAKRATDRAKEIQKEFKQGAKGGVPDKSANGKAAEGTPASAGKPPVGDKKAQDSAAAKAAGPNAAPTK